MASCVNRRVAAYYRRKAGIGGGGGRGDEGREGGEGENPPHNYRERRGRRNTNARTTRALCHPKPRSRNMRFYDRVMPIQKAAVRMPVRSSIRRRRFLRTATIITPMAQSRKPSSGQKVAELNPLLEALAGS